MEAFVIGPIGDQLAEPGSEARAVYEEAVTVYEEVIVEAWVAAGGDRDKITRGDFIDRPGDIPEQVIRATLEADVVIADLTGANANVMYELALRHASGRPSAQIGEKGRLPFDVSTLRTLLFKRSNAGFVSVRKKLTTQLEAITKGEFDVPVAGRLFQQFASTQSPAASPIEPTAGEGDSDVDPLEETGVQPGYLELRADMEDAMPELNERLTSVTSTMEAMGALAFEQAPVMASASTFREKLAAANRFASKLDPLARAFDRDSLEFAAKTGVVDIGIKDLFRHIATGQEWDEDTEYFLNMLVGMADAAHGSYDGLSGFHDSLNVLQDASSEVRPRVRLTQGAVQRLLSTYPTIYSWGEGAQELLDTRPWDSNSDEAVDAGQQADSEDEGSD